MIFGLQIIALVFALSMIYFAYWHYKKSEISRDEISVWLAIWFLTAFVIIYPDFLRKLAYNFFITRLFDLLVVGAFVFVITLAAILYIKVRRLENKLERIVRDDALGQIVPKRKKNAKK